LVTDTRRRIRNISNNMGTISLLDHRIGIDNTMVASTRRNLTSKGDL